MLVLSVPGGLGGGGGGGMVRLKHILMILRKDRRKHFEILIFPKIGTCCAYSYLWFCVNLASVKHVIDLFTLATQRRKHRHLDRPSKCSFIFVDGDCDQYDVVKVKIIIIIIIITY